MAKAKKQIPGKYVERELLRTKLLLALTIDPVERRRLEVLKRNLERILDTFIAAETGSIEYR